MEQIKGLWRDTKWLWIFFVLGLIVMSYVMSPIFLAMLPALPVCYAYFAYIRYDEHGNDRDLK